VHRVRRASKAQEVDDSLLDIIVKKPGIFADSSFISCILDAIPGIVINSEQADVLVIYRLVLKVLCLEF
jgi:hypothetical protein